LKELSDPGLHLEEMAGAAKSAVIFVDGLDEADFLADEMAQHAVTMCILRIGEAAKRLMKRHPEFVGVHSAVPWDKLAGMRDRIAHGYAKLDMTIVWKTVSEDMQDLLSAVEPLLAAFPSPNDSTL
jgi:uncharacterized protein with HEPN domain